MNKAKRENIVSKIIDVQNFADTEELTFPMDNPTSEEQNGWFDTFVDRLEEHVRGVLDEELPDDEEQGDEEPSIPKRGIQSTTRVQDLPVGTVFNVINGAWEGKVIEIDGVKHIHVDDTGHEFPIDDPDKHYGLHVEY